MFDLKQYLKEKAELVEAGLAVLLPDDGARITAAMRYSLLAGGKRIRPILCMAAAEAVGGGAADVLDAACALEMIHTYSLIHDDLPAMDNDVLRRGKPTCHVAFDEATAILAGDALLTLAFRLMASVPCHTADQRAGLLQVIGMAAQAAGYQGMIGGQMLDIQSEGQTLTLTALKALHAMKTGAIIEAAIGAGAVLSGGSTPQRQQLQVYARHIGLAFQIVDDVLNVEGDPALIGKAVGTDAQRRKNTYPGVMGLSQAKDYAADIIRQAIRALDEFDARATPLRAIATFIIERKH